MEEGYRVKGLLESQSHLFCWSLLVSSTKLLIISAVVSIRRRDVRSRVEERMDRLC
jgi:hypothetical protein